MHSVTVDVGDAPIIFETGRIAKQASGSVWVRQGDSVVLVTVCTAKGREGMNFLPLTVEYQEKGYAAGKIPGGFFKREARPAKHEILNCRITDRSIRPLFPEGFRDEVQVITTVVSHDGQHSTDNLSLCGASMALSISTLPWAAETGPIAGVRVGRVKGEFVANPTTLQLEDADLDVMVAVSKDAIMMVEGGAECVKEDDLIDALFFAHAEGQKVIDGIHSMTKEMGKEKTVFVSPEKDKALYESVKAMAEEHGLKAALDTRNKIQRYKNLDAVKANIVTSMKEKLGDDFAAQKGAVSEAFGDVKYNVMRKDCIATNTRLDGRAYDEIRPIHCEIGALPRTHGSALFTRGETQSLVTCTLGTKDDEQKIEDLVSTKWTKFMLHYNFPPYSVGEARMLRGTSRREIGHGALAERAVVGKLPSDEAFPYTVRIVSEILESNGSSSMASVCGATLAMWDAGVPMTDPVAGIAMGLIKEGDDIAILSDILGDEDHLGDMDFKVCGTAEGITAIQMDIKIGGVTREIMTTALEQAKTGRLHILASMKEAIEGPREELSQYAPRILTVRINPDKIRDIIGPGGKTIREITLKTGVKMDVQDDGTVKIFSVDQAAGEKAIQIIEDLTREAEVNRVYKGLVRKTTDFGAFVEIFPGTDGLVHISELSDKRVENVCDVVQEGDEVLVKVLSLDRDGKIRLSRRAAVGATAGEILPPEPREERPRRDDRHRDDRPRGPRGGGGGGRR
ncbi:MAG: polyribonucleotide nucleotidyltransferase [Deltaproteobacteria bacterium]|nr:polyribonucleotide nucleotidyltransferase [Deltaproteobacteria bacterium]